MRVAITERTAKLIQMIAKSIRLLAELEVVYSHAHRVA